ncbi:MAG: DUF2975 domain-containing protein [Ruminococcus sp.]|nr:DUF2975 domain-containing protein [Ruminococcus sp.]
MKKGNKLNKTLSIISKITEILHWIGAGISALMVLISIVDKSFFAECVAEEGPNFATLEAYSFNVNALTQNGDINHFAVTMAFVGIMLTFILMALIFRNLDIILSTIMGKYKHATSTSPFQKDVVRRVREMGIFAISMPIIGFIITTIITGVSLANGIESEVSVSLEGIIIGLVCLCLSQIFSYGANLEEEVDGLL